MYPLNYTVFMRKVNALFEGDENGDFVLAEDVNELQEAIERLESHIGVSYSDKSISERLELLSGLSKMRLKTMFREGAGLTLTSSHGGMLSSYDMVAMKAPRPDVLEKLVGAEVRGIVEVVVGATPLSQVQTEIGAAKSAGASHIWLKNFKWSDGVTRTKQEQVLASVREAGCAIILSLTPTEIMSETFDAVNNIEGLKLSVGEDTIVDMGDFSYVSGMPATSSQMTSAYTAYGNLRKETGVQLFMRTTRERYRYDQAVGLLFSIDGVWMDETTVSKVPNWQNLLGGWKTDSPEVISSGDGLRRYIKDGSIEVLPTTTTFLLDGFQPRSEDIVFGVETIPGEAIENNSIGKEKIASYDADKIIAHLNTDATTKIHWNAIEDMSGDMLPGNIPAANMQQNVIEAINKQAGDFVETLDIVDAAIKTVSSSKLTGDIDGLRMRQNVISAINTAPGSINVTSGNIDALTGDTVNVTDVTAQTVNGQILNMTEGFIGDLSTNNIESLLRIDAKDIFAQYIKTIQLDADVLKVQDMLVDDLISQKITTETLDAVMAHIGTAEINNLVAESIKAQIVKSELVVSLNSMVGTATIDGALIGDASIIDAQIVNLNASKINTGSINTGLVTLDSPDGHLRINDETIRIYDAEDAQGQRRLRTLLGNTGEIVPGSYGLVVLGADGTTRLYDNTGVYNAGIHDNAISNGKLQDDSVDGRVIVAESILAEHISAGEINALHLAAGSIVAGSAVIAEGAIGSAQISELDGGKITADSIEGTSIKAGTITTDLMSIGFGANQMKYGYDSFEIFEEGTTPVDVFTPSTNAVVSKDIRRVGEKALKIDGNNTDHIVYLQKMAGNYFNALKEGETYYVSAYMYTTDTTGVDTYVGIVHATGTLWGAVKRIKQSDGFIRVVSEIVIPAGVTSGSVALRTVKANAVVYVDCVMLEEKEPTATEPTMWLSASITEVSGDMITTGTINATKGITFQAGAVVIDEDGIQLSKLGGGSVKLDENGLVIDGGAITINGGLSEEDLNPALTSKWNSASESISDILDNGVITVYEKYGLSREWERIDASFKSIWSQAVLYNATGDAALTAYQQAKESLKTFLFTTNDQNNGLPILAQANSANDSVVDGGLYASLAKDVYDKELLASSAIENAIGLEMQATKDDIQGLEASAASVSGSLANILSDDKITGNERKNIRDAIVEILGQSPSGTSALPLASVVNTYTTGSYAASRLSAVQAGVSTGDSAYVGIETAYTALRTYLNGITASGYYLWDVSEASKNIVHDIVGETFRSQWQSYYNAQLTLQTRTAKRVSDAKAETETYASSYRNQLVLNGFGDIGSNRNFSGLTYTTSQKLTGAGSFSSTTAGVKRTDDFIVVEARKTYILTMAIKSSTSSNTHRLGIECYDGSGVSLGVRHLLKTSGGSTSIPSTTSWARYEGRVGGEGTGAGTVSDSTFPSGTKKIKVWMDLNIGGVTNTVYLSDVTFEVERIEANKDYNGIVMSSENGMTITSNRNTTSMSATKGLEIKRNSDNFKVFELDSNTGDLSVTGNINMQGGTISWEQVNTPSASQVGAATASDVDNAIQGINIGGANLLSPSETISAASNDGVNNPVTVNLMEEDGLSFYRYAPTAGSPSPVISLYETIYPSSVKDKAWKGKDVTFSLRVRCSKIGATVRFQPFTYAEQGGALAFAPSRATVIADGRWQTMSYVFENFPEDLHTNESMISVSFDPDVVGDMAGETLDVRGYQIEFGNKATDWSPSPYEVKSKLDDFETLTAKNGTVTVINGSMVQSGTIKGDYIDAKNLVVRDAGNVETLKVDSSGNVTINGVVTIKSGSNVYTKTESDTAVKNSTDTAFAADQGLAMKIGYSTYTTATANNIYFHGFSWDSANKKYVAADVNGRLLGDDNITFVSLNKGRLNLSAGVPSGSKGFIVYDQGTYWYIVWNRSTGLYAKYNSGVSGHGGSYSLSTTSYIIGELEI